MMNELQETSEEIVLEENQIICALTDQVKPSKSKELTSSYFGVRLLNPKE